MPSLSTISSWSKTDYQGASAELIASMSPAQVAQMVHPDWLLPAAVSGFTAAQVPSIGISWGYMSASWLNALTPGAFAAIPTTGVAQIGSTATAGLDVAHAAALTTTQIASLGSPQSLAVAAVAALSAAQLAAIPAAKWGSMPAAWLNAIPPSVFSTLPGASIIKISSAATAGLDVAHVQALTVTQMASVYWPESFSLAAVAALTPAQMGAIKTNFKFMTAAWLNATTPAAFAAISTTGIGQLAASHLVGLDAAHTQAFTATQLNALTLGNLSAASIATLTTAQLGSLSASKWASVSATWINAVPVANFATVSATALYGITSAATAGLDLAHVQALSPTQFAGLRYPESLSLSVVAGLTPTQIGALTQSFGYMSAAWMNALTPEALAAITTKGIGQLTSATVAALDVVHVQALTSTQLDAMSVGNLSTASMAALTTAQLTGMAAATWGKFSAAQLNAIPRDKFAQIPVAGIAKLGGTVTAGLDVAHVQALTAAQVAALGSPSSLSLAAVAALSPAQVAAISTDFYWMSSSWLNALSLQAFAAIRPECAGRIFQTAMSGLDAAHVAVMTPDQLKATWCLDQLNASAIAVLSPTQVAALSVDFWYWAKPAWINSMSVGTFASLSAPAIAKMTSTTVAGLDLAHVQALTGTQLDAMNLNGMTAASVAALTQSQITSISAAKWGDLSAAWINATDVPDWMVVSPDAVARLSIAAQQGLDAAHVRAMSTAQIAALQNADHLNAAAVAALSAEQGAAISTSFYWMGSAWLNAMSADAFAAIPTGKLTSITTTAIAGLDAAHVAALGGAQVAALSDSQLGALTATQIAALSSAGIAGLSMAQVARLTTAQIAGLTGSQAAVLSAAQLDALTATQIGALSGAAVAGLSAAQLNALGTDIGYVSPAALAALPAGTFTQLTFMQLSALQPVQIAALTQSQLGALSAAQVNYLTAGQLAALDGHAQWLSTSAAAGLNNVNLISIYASLSPAQLAILTPAQTAAVAQAGTALTGLLQTMGTGSVRTQVEAVINSGESLFSYESLLEVLQGVNASIGTGGLTQTDMSDLKALVTAVGQAVGTDSYLYEISSNVVNGNSSNAFWTGGATRSESLGNLAVGSSALQLDRLIDKWFLGEDLPTWSTSSAYTYTFRDAPLFSASGAQVAEISQGGIGDCYMIAAMVNIANSSSALIESMFTDNGNGTYGVRFYGVGDDPLYVTVNTSLAGWTANSSNGSLWVSLLEKAYVEYEVQRYGEANSYASIGGGYASGMSAIAGRDCVYYSCNSYTLQAWTTTVKSTVLAAMARGEQVMYSSFQSQADLDNGKTNLVDAHQFSVLGYDSAKDELILRNPWGHAGGSSWNGVFDLTFEQLYDSGSSLLVTKEGVPTGAIDAKYTVNAAASQLIQTMALSDGTAAATAALPGAGVLDRGQILLAATV